MSGFVIEELILPDNLDGEDAADFVELVTLRNKVEAAILGTDAISMTAAALLPQFGSNPQRARRHFVVRIDGRIVARALFAWMTVEDAPAAWLTVDVLESHRRQGLGSALVTMFEGLAADLGRRVIQVSVLHTSTPGGARIPSPTGFGDLPADDAGVQFLLHHGYTLEMVGRVSSLDLTESADSLEAHRRLAQEKAGPDYRVVTWTGRTPEEWRSAIAVMKTAMSVEEPSAGLATIEDVWDAERVRENDDRQEGSGLVLVGAAAEHVPSGTLAAYTELGLPDGEAKPATQEDTLVMPAHRGRRLGMLLKAANAQQVIAIAPSTPLITTFNAEDNAPMLRVNVELGFRAIGLEGSWQKTLR